MGGRRSSLREALRALAVLGVGEMRQGTAPTSPPCSRAAGAVPGSCWRLATPGSRAVRGSQVVEPGSRRSPRGGSTMRRRPADAPLTRGRRARQRRGVHVGRRRTARRDQPGGLQRHARAPPGVDPRARPRLPPPDRRQAPVREQSAMDHGAIAAAMRDRERRRRSRDARHLENVAREGGDGIATARRRSARTTLAPPPAKRLEFTKHHRWSRRRGGHRSQQAAHAGSEVDLGRQCAEDGETAADGRWTVRAG